MTKSEWKALYSFYRKKRFNFNCYIETANLPCGSDDAAYERFEHSEQEFVSNNPILKKVLTIMDETDMLKWRVDDLSWYQDSPEHKVKRLAQMVTRYREAV